LFAKEQVVRHGRRKASSVARTVVARLTISTRAGAAATRRRGSSVRAAVAIHVGLVGIRSAATGRRGTAGVVSIIGIAGTTGSRIVVLGTTARTTSRRTVVAATGLVVVTGRSATAVIVTARAVVAGWTTAAATATIVVIRWRKVASATGWWGGTRAVTAATRRRVVALSVGDTADRLSLEFTVVKLLDRGAEIGLGLIFDEASTIALATDFRIDDIKSRLAREVLQILESSVSVSPEFSNSKRSSSARGSKDPLQGKGTGNWR